LDRTLIALLFVAPLVLMAMACSGESSPTPTSSPTHGVAVTVDFPAEVPQGSEFAAGLSIVGVEGLASFQVDVSYDPLVLEVVGGEGSDEGVAGGVVGSTSFSTNWAFVPLGVQGKLRIIGRSPGVEAATGDGMLAEVTFRAIGTPGEGSDVVLSEGMLVDSSGHEIADVVWQIASVELTE